jgi:hypothetical protein
VALAITFGSSFRPFVSVAGDWQLSVTQGQDTFRYCGLSARTPGHLRSTGNGESVDFRQWQRMAPAAALNVPDADLCPAEENHIRRLHVFDRAVTLASEIPGIGSSVCAA